MCNLIANEASEKNKFFAFYLVQQIVKSSLESLGLPSLMAGKRGSRKIFYFYNKNRVAYNERTWRTH